MTRRQQQEALVGEDSFLDVVGNLVGVLIILVAVVSVQAGRWVRSQAAEELPTHRVQAEEQALFLDEKASLSIEAEVADLQKAIAERTMIQQVAEQVLRQTLIENRELEIEIERRRELASQDDRQRIDQAAEISELQRTVERLKSQMTAAEVVITQRTEILHYPTPIAKTVFSDEIHFRLQNGRISFVPLDAMLQKIKAQAESRLAELTKSPIVSGVIGPDSGFMMEYQLAGQRYERGDQRGVQVQFLGFVMYPVTNCPSEDLRDALQEDSQFRSRLNRLTPSKTTVSVWVYPESYPQFLELKQWLRERGYQVAAWPLDDGAHISGGPAGLRSSAQ